MCRYEKQEMTNGEYVQIAEQLGYDCIALLEKAKSANECDRIMRNERKRAIDAERKGNRKAKKRMQSWIWRDCA